MKMSYLNIVQNHRSTPDLSKCRPEIFLLLRTVVINLTSLHVRKLLPISKFQTFKQSFILSHCFQMNASGPGGGTTSGPVVPAMPHADAAASRLCVTWSVLTRKQSINETLLLPVYIKVVKMSLQVRSQGLEHSNTASLSHSSHLTHVAID